MRERVKARIKQDQEFDTFAEACSWPDSHADEAPGTTSTAPGCGQVCGWRLPDTREARCGSGRLRGPA